MKKTKKKGTKKGFTLIELLVVIAIIAILSVVVVLTLNPAEMLRRSRDSSRVSDLGIMKTAISLYLADVSTTSMGASGLCYMQYAGTAPASGTTAFGEFASNTIETAAFPNTGAGYVFSPNNGLICNQWFGTATLTTSSASRSVTGNGWLPINLSVISSGAPVGQWPADPSYSAGSACATAGNCNGSAAHFYSYIATSTNNGYKIAAKMESTLYSASGTSDLESTDGGTDNNQYEQGTTLTL